MRDLISAVVLLAAPATASFGQSLPASSTGSDAAVASETVNAGQVVEALAVALEENFVSPAKGKDYAAAIRARLASGAYAHLATREEFAKAVTADLQAVHQDGHLGLTVDTPRSASAQQPKPKRKAIEKAGWVGEGVAYIRMIGFPSDPQTLDELRSFVTGHAGAKSLIIDVRQHSGGGGAEMDVLLPALFEEPTALLRLEMRGSVADRERAELESSPTMALIDSPAGIIRHEHRVLPAEGAAMKKTRVYVLTSRDTVSASEHLAAALKRTGRATLIGETTRGAGNFGRPFKLPGGFSAFIPFGRTVDPDTGEGWEGTGVKPDIEIAPEKALEEALELAGVNKSAEAALTGVR